MNLYYNKFSLYIFFNSQQFTVAHRKKTGGAAGPSVPAPLILTRSGCQTLCGTCIEPVVILGHLYELDGCKNLP